jgi:hypothetical protein
MEWKFAVNDGHLDDVGFKDNDIEKFGKDPARSIVREAIQNSCDALDVDGKQSQVKVIIRQGKVYKVYLPGFADIENHIRSCIKKSNDPAENAEIQRHVDAFESDCYTYLEIADYNTTGMNLKSFEGLTQGIFKSVHKRSGSQGSKGVGKAAYYASSYLRTMLIVTRSDEGLRYRGAAKIANHPDPNDDNNLNYKGFYGDLEPKQENDIPKLFRRSDKGTSIFIVGLWKIQNLESDIIKEVLRNYWFAILKDQLIVTVGNINIDSSNVHTLINDYFPDYKDYKSGEKQNPRPYIETVQHGKCYEKDIANIGSCSLWLYQSDKFLNLGYVARFRKTKMLIYKFEDLGKGFSGVFLCDNDTGNIFLKEIENDEHNIWDPKINSLFKDRAKDTISEISLFIKESYIDFAGLNNTDSFTVDMLDDLFSFSDGMQSGTRLKPKPRSVPQPSEGVRDSILESAKFTSFNRDGRIFYRLEIRSKIAEKGQKFKLSIGTDSSKDSVFIISSSFGDIDRDVLTLDIIKGVNIIDEIEFDSSFLVAPLLTSIS